MEFIREPVDGEARLNDCMHQMLKSISFKNRHQQMEMCAKSSSDFLKSFGKAIEHLKNIVDGYGVHIKSVENRYCLDDIEFYTENNEESWNCFLLSVTFTNGNKDQDLVLRYYPKAKTPWVESTGGLIERSGMPASYIEGIMDAMNCICKNHKVFRRLRNSRNESDKTLLERNDFFDEETFVCLKKIINDREFLKLIKDLGIKKVIEIYESYLAKVSQEVEFDKKNIFEICNRNKMPDPPPPMCNAKTAINMNIGSGVYFAWKHEKCFYVGKSTSISSRLKNHDKIFFDDDISWINMPKKEMDINELFYIWLLRPKGNSQSNKLNELLGNQNDAS